MEKGEFREAAAEFQNELQLEPNHPQALTYLGDIALKNSDFAVARADLERVKSQPGSVRLATFDLGILDAQDKRWRLARLLQATGQREEAATQFAR